VYVNYIKITFQGYFYNVTVYLNYMILIEGTTFPLNEFNSQGWGIPFSEKENAINSLQKSVLKVCPGQEHACSLKNSVIGRVVAAWGNESAVKARYAVTNPIAERKITEGKWDLMGWSAELTASAIEKWWGRDVKVKNMTLVKDPAWKDATWKLSEFGKYSFSSDQGI
jgi:hypothetical protein